MKPTMEILERIKKNSEENKDEVFTRIYRYLLRPDIYFVAYQNLYSNNGASTKGVDDDTADGFSEAKIERIIKCLEDESYQPKPFRRVYIKKPNGKIRPLGIPSFTDKLVQEAVRIILEAIYEPIFMDTSHGFRPNRSCHTALQSVKYEFRGARWFIEGDIKGCFDNINHNVLVSCINKKIKDARFTKLIYKFLKAGFVDDFVYNNTYSGCAQGGIISPILANIYLHELDKFVENLSKEFNEPATEKFTADYRKAQNAMAVTRKKIKKAENADDEVEKAELLKVYKSQRATLLKTPCKSQTDKKLKYVRYADDFIIGVNGSKVDCVRIKQQLSDFISNTLKMELSEEKTLITHSNTYAKFLGYNIRVSGFDCSGFVSWVINNCGNGWNVGRCTADELRSHCSQVSPSEAKPGDLIFFQGTYSTPGASHVGIYVGNNMMIHCGKPVQYTSIASAYWQEHFMAFGRLH